MHLELFYNKEYCLKYKDTIVFTFQMKDKSIHIVHQELLPISMQNKEQIEFDLIRQFCSERILMAGRKHCKELLTACKIDEQNDVIIGILSHALSFRDNYWISSVDSEETWGKINLYQNEFSVKIAKVALTGKLDSLTNDILGDNIYTGELTGKGTKAKCFYRSSQGVLLLKNETMEEITSEIIVYFIARFFKVNCNEYIYKKIYNKDCSVCRIHTSETNEMIPCRDILSYYNSHNMTYESDYYKFFMKIDPINFIKMQILDYLTLNTDRNRDNFGILSVNRQMKSLYPLFDHDSCFKGKSVSGLYFPTGLTFYKTVEMLKTVYGMFYQKIVNDLQNLEYFLSTENFKKVFLVYKSKEQYDRMMERLRNIL